MCTVNEGEIKSIHLVIDKQTWIQYREAVPTVVALLGAYFIFDFQMPNECPGALFSLLRLPRNTTVRERDYVSFSRGAALVAMHHHVNLIAYLRQLALDFEAFSESYGSRLFGSISEFFVCHVAEGFLLGTRL